MSRVSSCGDLWRCSVACVNGKRVLCGAMMRFPMGESRKYRQTKVGPPQPARARVLTLARSLPILSPSLHSIRFITAKARFPWTRNFSRTGTSSLLSNYPTKKRSPCYRDALHQLPPRSHTALQFEAPTDCNRTSPRLWIHWPLPFSPRLDGAGPVPRFSPIH